MTKHKLSLRMRVTLISGLALITICLLLSGVILYNANNFIIGPTKTEDGEILGKTGMDGDALGETDINDDILVPVSPDDRYEVYETNVIYFYRYTLIGIAIALICGIVLIYVVTGIALKPLNKLKDEIASTDETDLSKRITDFSAGDELQSLANSFNGMLTRIQSAFERERSFSAGAAHELKTPLAVIKTNMDVLALSEHPTSDEYADTFEIVKNQTARMSKLIDDLFAMCAMNGYEIEDKVSPGELVSEIILDLQSEIQKKNIIVNTSVLSCTVKANSVMLRHAISNLIQNAIKYNVENGSINIGMKLDSGKCRISVSDTGIGISNEASSHIFEPFYREDKSRSRRIGGAGLGLSIVKSIIEQHDGTVCYHKNQPQGSVFTIELPII